MIIQVKSIYMRMLCPALLAHRSWTEGCKLTLKILKITTREWHQFERHNKNNI